ncbi:hypothetical protein [Clostridium beijerinckii]|uniref:Uncharacterized protein n=1 Tax=Clostridium beijerinckii TaxID=1520 RepID=A0AAX0B0N1_CLOBE|nr:hypothetical protein [Clostridium beijerinckii]NRT88870.1 hypothetical protein [Clostridium beijerinckii]NYC74325.1 hypothetical protein [Clostridium beijerinckii]
MSTIINLNTTTNLERLKLALNNKAYYSDDEYKLFLEENGLYPDDKYVKDTMEIELLETQVAILETLSNDVDLMRRIVVEEVGLTTDQAYLHLEKRIKSLNEKILTLKEMKETQEDYSNVRPMFFN